jgi:putative NIF3 family GTP cyclohydrolase 1 type 2
MHAAIDAARSAHTMHHPFDIATPHGVHTYASMHHVEHHLRVCAALQPIFDEMTREETAYRAERDAWEERCREDNTVIV